MYLRQFLEPSLQNWCVALLLSCRMRLAAFWGVKFKFKISPPDFAQTDRYSYVRIAQSIQRFCRRPVCSPPVAAHAAPRRPRRPHAAHAAPPTPDDKTRPTYRRRTTRSTRYTVVYCGRRHDNNSHYNGGYTVVTSKTPIFIRLEYETTSYHDDDGRT